MSVICSVDGLPGYVIVREAHLNSKDREIERLTGELSEAKAKLRVHDEGRNLIVSPEFLDAKDREIRRLEHAVYHAESGGLRKENDALRARNEKLEKDVAHLRGLIGTGDGHGNQLRQRLNAARAEAKALKRLMNDRGTYDASMIQSFDERTPEELAKYVDFELANGGKTSFAAACLVLMWLKYEQQRAANQITCERIANAAAAINRLHEEIAAD